MERKLVQVGKSLAVTLPVDVVKAFKLEKGQTVEVSVHPMSGAITIRPGVRHFDDGKVSKRFKDVVDVLLGDRSELHRRLAR